jgi:hypothetical protein
MTWTWTWRGQWTTTRPPNIKPLPTHSLPLQIMYSTDYRYTLYLPQRLVLSSWELYSSEITIHHHTLSIPSLYLYVSLLQSLFYMKRAKTQQEWHHRIRYSSIYFLNSTYFTFFLLIRRPVYPQTHDFYCSQTKLLPPFLLCMYLFSIVIFHLHTHFTFSQIQLQHKIVISNKFYLNFTNFVYRHSCKNETRHIIYIYQIFFS